MRGYLAEGMVQVYTGSGKGKTTAAFGQALRAYGSGLRVAIVQFLKDGSSGEVKALRKVPEIEIFCFGSSGFVGPSGPTRKHILEASTALKQCSLIMAQNTADVLILDEVCTAVALGLIEEQAVLDLLQQRPEKMELILTGRGATATILRSADLVTEMLAVKHPFTLGKGPRRGIEF